MTVFLTPAQVAAIHSLQSPQPLRSLAVLAGAVTRPQASWAGTLLYPTTTAQAAALLTSICQAQAFLDGNKRTAWVACDVFLALNGYHLGDIPDGEILTLMDGISRGIHETDDVAGWLIERTNPINKE